MKKKLDNCDVHGQHCLGCGKYHTEHIRLEFNRILEQIHFSNSYFKMNLTPFIKRTKHGFILKPDLYQRLKKEES